MEESIKNELRDLRHKFASKELILTELKSIDQIITDFHISLGLNNLYLNDTETFYFTHELTVIKETLKGTDLTDEEKKSELDEARQDVLDKMELYINRIEDKGNE